MEPCRCYNPGLRGRGVAVVEAHWTRRGALFLAAVLVTAAAGTLIGCAALRDPEALPAEAHATPSAVGSVSDRSLERIRLQPIVHRILVGTTADSRARASPSQSWSCFPVDLPRALRKPCAVK